MFRRKVRQGDAVGCLREDEQEGDEAGEGFGNQFLFYALLIARL